MRTSGVLERVVPSVFFGPFPGVKGKVLLLSFMRARVARFRNDHDRSCQDQDNAHDWQETTVSNASLVREETVCVCLSKRYDTAALLERLSYSVVVGPKPIVEMLPRRNKGAEH